MLKVKTDVGVMQHIDRDEYYLETDKDYHYNWKQCFQGKISKEINRGSFAAVFRARTADNMHCAIKKPHPHILSFEESLESYKTEIKIHSTLKHPSIVAFYGVCQVENHLPPLIIMERMWKSLYSFIEQKLLSVFPLSLKLHMMLDVAKGLSYLHSQNIIHRDLTLSNILLTTELKAKISDFGGAQKLDATECNSKSCSIPGNFLYMPPESFAGNPICGPKLDVFCFGCNILCIMNETIPCHDDQFSKVSVAEKYLKGIPSGYPLLRELAASCLNYEPENRPGIEYILTVLNTIISSICIVSSNEHAHVQKAQIRCTPGVKKADINIANIAIRKWLKELKEHDNSKTIRRCETLTSSNSVVSVLKHNKLESGQQMWLHNLPAKFGYALTEVYTIHLETLSFYFLKSFTQPNSNTLSKSFHKAIRTTTNTRVTYFVAFSQSSSKQTNEIGSIVVSFSKKQLITVNTITKRKSFIACTVPTEFNVLMLNSSSNSHVTQKRQVSQANEVSLGEIKYHCLQNSTIQSLHVEAVRYTQPQIIFEELFTKRKREKFALENLTSYSKLVYSHQWLSSSGSEDLIKPSSIAKKFFSLSNPSSSVVGSKTLATYVYHKVSYNYFGFHTTLVLQSYKLCSYQHTLCIYYAQLIITYQTKRKYANVLLCVAGFYGSYFSANSMHGKTWSTEFPYRTLYDQAPSMHKIGFVRSLVTYACKIIAQRKSEAYWISELMSANSCSQLALSTSHDSKFYFPPPLDNQSCYINIGADNFFEVRDDCAGTEAASISLCANGDCVMKVELYAMPSQPSVNRSTFSYTEPTLLAQQETPLGQSLSSNDLTNYSTYNVNHFNHNRMYTVGYKGVHWYESLYVFLIRQKEIVLNHNEQPVLSLQTISKHISHQLCISLICNGQAIGNVLYIRLQYSFTSYIVQRKDIILSVNVQMHTFSYALNPYMVEKFCKVLVPCLNTCMLSSTSCIFPCQHPSMPFKRYSHSVSLTNSAISYQCLKSASHIFNDGWKEAVKLCKNSITLPGSLMFDKKETLKFIKVNTNAEVVPIRQTKDVISQQECLVTSPAKEALEKYDDIKFTKQLDEWLCLQNFVRVRFFHNAGRVFSLCILLLESKWLHKPKSSIAQMCFSESPLADNNYCQEIQSTESMQTLAKNDSFHCKIESYGQSYEHASMSTRLHHCKSSNRHLVMQHIQVILYQHSLRCNTHSCRMQALTLTRVIKSADQLLCIVYSCQISANIVAERLVMLNMQYIFSYQEFNASSLCKNYFEASTGFSNVHNSLQINLQKKKCSGFIANVMVLETPHRYLFNNASQESQLEIYPSVDLLLADQVFASPKSSTPKDDKLCTLNSAIDKDQQIQTIMNFESALTGTKEHLTSPHQGNQSFDTALTTITYDKQLTTFPSNAAKKCTYHSKMPSASSYVAYHNLKNVTDQCTGIEGLKETLLVSSTFESKKDNTMIASSCYFNSFPQAICGACGACGTSIHHHKFLSNYCCLLTKLCASGHSRNKLIQPNYHYVAAAVTEENQNHQDKALHTSDKHNNSNPASNAQRKGKKLNSQENKHSSSGGSNRGKRDGNESNESHNDDGHDKKSDFKPALFDVLRFLLLLLLLCYVWQHLSSRLLSQLTKEYHIRNDVTDSRLPDISNKSMCQLIKVGWIGKKCQYTIFRLHFKPSFVAANASTTAQTFLQNSLKDKQISTVNNKSVTSLSPLCNTAVLPKLQLMTAIKYKSYQLQVWNLGIECFQCNATVVLIICEDRLQPIILKIPRIQSLIPALMENFSMIFASLDAFSKKPLFNSARSELQISIPNYTVCLTSMLDFKGTTCAFDRDLRCTTHEFCEAMHEFLKHTYHRCHTFDTLSRPQCSSNDGTSQNTTLSYKLGKRYDIFSRSYKSVTQAKQFYMMHAMCNNENHGNDSLNYARSYNVNSNICKLEYNQKLSAHNNTENGSHHSNKNTRHGNNHNKEKDFNPLYFLSLLQLLLMLLLVDILIVFQLLWLSFEHHICNDELVNNGLFKECIINDKRRHELIQVILIDRNIYQKRPQVILDVFQDKLCRKNKQLGIIACCILLAYSNTLVLQVWNFSAVYYRATTPFNHDKLYLKIVSKQGLILSQQWLDVILFDYRECELMFTPQCQVNCQTINTISKFHDVNRTIHHLMILSRFLLPRIHKWIFHIENNTHKHSMLEVYTFLKPWMSNFSLHGNRIPHQSLSTYKYCSKHVCYELTSYCVIPSRNISGSRNEEIFSSCFQESTVDILGSQNSLLHSTCTIPTLTTEKRVDAFRPINIVSGRTINYYPNSGSEDDKDMFDTWQVVIGRTTLYDASGIHTLTNEQHHEIIYGDGIVNFDANENYNVVIPPEEPGLANNFNDNIMIVSLLYVSYYSNSMYM